ncbi:MAG: hypothetical protein ACXVEE_06355 [Polyangiales bacterium]
MRLREAALSIAVVLAGCEPTYVVMPNNASATSVAQNIPVYPSKSLGRPCEIIAIFDFHTDADSEDKGFDLLRERARAIGADAVIGAEFEHGENGGPSHLSGMAVRLIAPSPPYEVIGEIDIASSPDSPDKGLEAMLDRARKMGADKVVDVVFEHGEEGGQGHLRGKAARFKR